MTDLYDSYLNQLLKVLQDGWEELFDFLEVPDCQILITKCKVEEDIYYISHYRNYISICAQLFVNGDSVPNIHHFEIRQSLLRGDIYSASIKQIKGWFLREIIKILYPGIDIDELYGVFLRNSYNAIDTGIWHTKNLWDVKKALVRGLFVILHMCHCYRTFPQFHQHL